MKPEQGCPGEQGYGTQGEYNAWVAAAESVEDLQHRGEQVPDAMKPGVRSHCRRRVQELRAKEARVA